MDLQAGMIEYLQDLRRAGLTHLQLPPAAVTEPKSQQNRSAHQPTSHHSVDDARQKTLVGAQPSGTSIADPATPTTTKKELQYMEASATRDEREQRLEEVASRVSQCQRCQELANTRTQTVFGVGNPEANVMFIGEAPGADEDRQGEPFVGRAGKLLNDIIAACGWTREEIYICNILRCRPPGNRNPTPVEAGNCREYLDAQIETVDPGFIVCWGSIAAQNLLDRKDSIGKMRQKFFEHGNAKVLCTYHPSYLLRNPSAKKPVWEDMKFLLAEMGIDPATVPGSRKKG